MDAWHGKAHFVEGGVEMTQEELIEALRIIYAGLPKDDRPYGCIGAQEAILDHDASQRALIEQQAREMARLKEICERVAEEVMDYLNTANVNGKPDEPELWQAVERMKGAHRQEIARLRDKLERISRHVPIMGSTGDYRQGQLDVLESVKRIAKEPA